MGDGLEDVKRVSSVEKNIVVSPAALEAAKYLERTYGTPYETGYPLVDELVCDMDLSWKKGALCTATSNWMCYPGGNIKESTGCTGNGGELVYDETGTSQG